MRECEFYSKGDWAMCGLLYRLIWASVMRSCQHRRVWSCRHSSNFLPQLNAYPKESVVAEKFEAIVKLGMANSRMKDFYDLWVLAQRFQFESGALAAAIQATFVTPETVLPISLR